MAKDPAPYVERLVLALCQENAKTAYGSMYGFGDIKSLDAWRRVPVVDYDALEPWVMRIAEGEPRVLTEEPVLIFERSSGSTSANKLIPYTRGLLREFSAATAPWFYGLYAQHPKLLGTSSYWSVSQAQKRNEYTKGGVRIGFEDDTEYFSWAERKALSRLLAVPSSVSHCADMETWRRETLVHLLAAEDLGMISVWSPTFLTSLLRDVNVKKLSMDARISRRRREQIERAAGDFEKIWPKLALISCWADGASAPYVGSLKALFPTTPFQPKGLLATEGVVSFPNAKGAVAAVTSHVLEFLDEAQQARWPWELQVGARYSPVLSTRGGFYRYHLKDVVECVGFDEKLPLLRFVAKLDRVSDLCGEKLNASFVEQCLSQLRAAHTFGFAMLAPDTTREPARYTLYIEGDAAVGPKLDAALCESHHYRYARDLGQLAPLATVVVDRGAERYEEGMRARGIKSGDIKPTVLDGRTDWAHWMLSAKGMT